MRRRGTFLAAALLLPLLLSGVRAAEPADGPFAGEDALLRRLELKEARVVDAVRLIAETSGLNVVTTTEAGAKTVTLYVRSMEAGRAIETLCKVAGLWYRRDEDTRTYRVMTTEEYQRDHIVYRKDELRVFTLQHPNAIVIATAVEDLFGPRVELSLGVEEEEALDMPPGFELGRIGMGTGFTGGTAAAGDRRSGGAASTRRRVDRLRRSTAGGVRGRESERVLDEELTPEQLARLDERRGGDGAASAEDLLGISRRDPTIYVTVNRQHNLIVVRTSDGVAMDEIAQLVDELDRPTPQVLLEMKILELTVGDSFRSVFDIEYATGADASGPPSAQPVNPLLPGADTASRNVLGVGNFPLEGGTLVYQFLNDHVRARLQLLERDNRINTLATPVLLASNNRPARMFVGEERVLTTGVSTDVITPGTGATTTAIEPITEVRDVGNTLVVVPKINADRTVTLFLLQDSSSVQPSSTTIPVPTADGGITAFPIDTINTANLQATVVAKDGMTLAIGGLIRVDLLDTEEKVPLLGDIPVIRFFFRRKVREHTKRELLLLITPRVLFTPTEADEATRRRLEALSDHPWVREGDRAYEEELERLRGPRPEDGDGGAPEEER